MRVGAFSKLTLQNGLTNQNVSLNNAFFSSIAPQSYEFISIFALDFTNNYYQQQKNNE